jgi:hypothetical protein
MGYAESRIRLLVVIFRSVQFTLCWRRELRDAEP